MVDIRLLGMLFGVALLTDTADAAVRLDLLSACNDLATTQDALRSTPTSCRSAVGAIERRIAETAAGSPNLRFCFVASPSPALQRLSCARFDLDRERYHYFLCHGRVRANDIAQYKADYARRYATLVRPYLSAARQCAISSHDADEAQNTLFPWILNWVAEADFGFVLGLGDRNNDRAANMALHGFGKLDPNLGFGSDQLEYFMLDLRR